MREGVMNGLAEGPNWVCGLGGMPNSMTAGLAGGLGGFMDALNLSPDFKDRSGAFTSGVVAESVFMKTGIGAGALFSSPFQGPCSAEALREGEEVGRGSFTTMPPIIGGLGGNGIEIFPISVFCKLPTIGGRGTLVPPLSKGRLGGVIPGILPAVAEGVGRPLAAGIFDHPTSENAGFGAGTGIGTDIDGRAPTGTIGRISSKIFGPTPIGIGIGTDELAGWYTLSISGLIGAKILLLIAPEISFAMRMSTRKASRNSFARSSGCKNPKSTYPAKRATV
jgi:hypothetical protein